MSYTLHAVIVKKPVDLTQAKKIAKNFITDKPLKYRETQTSYRFENFPKGEFEPKTYKTKKLNKDVSLIFGTHKERKHELVEGGDILEKIKSGLQNFFLKYNPLSLGIKSVMGQVKSDREARMK